MNFYCGDGRICIVDYARPSRELCVSYIHTCCHADTYTSLKCVKLHADYSPGGGNQSDEKQSQELQRISLELSSPILQLGQITSRPGEVIG